MHVSECAFTQSIIVLGPFLLSFAALSDAQSAFRAGTQLSGQIILEDLVSVAMSSEVQEKLDLFMLDRNYLWRNTTYIRCWKHPNADRCFDLRGSCTSPPCEDGYEGVSPDCTLCSAGFYCNSEAKQACPPGTWSDPGAVNSTDCYTAGFSADHPITDMSLATDLTATTYWIKPPGAAAAFQAYYSGDDYHSTGRGYWRWWRAVDQQHPTVNYYGQGLQWNWLMVEEEGGEFQTIGYDNYHTFDLSPATRSPPAYAAPHGTRSGFGFLFGNKGGHGIYPLTISGWCFWVGGGDVEGAIGAAFVGSTCDGSGAGAMAWIYGYGNSGASFDPTRGGGTQTWSFWFSW